MADVTFTTSLDPAKFKAGLNEMANAAEVKARIIAKTFDKAAAAAEKSSRGSTGSVRGGAFGGRNTGYMGGQLAMQAQDVAVMAQMGMSTSRIIAQQGSQILSIFGPGGAIAGGVLAIGAAILSWSMGTEKAEKAAANYATKLKEINANIAASNEARQGAEQEMEAVAVGQKLGPQAEEKLRLHRKLSERLKELDKKHEEESLTLAESFKQEAFGATRQHNAQAVKDNKALQQRITESAKAHEAATVAIQLEFKQKEDILDKKHAADSLAAQQQWEERQFADQQQRDGARADAAAQIAQEILDGELDEIQQSDAMAAEAAREDEENEKARMDDIQAFNAQRIREAAAAEQKIQSDRATIIAQGGQAYDALKGATFGKSPLDMQRARNAARREERKDKRWQDKMDKTGGMTGIRRGLGGEIESGILPGTDKRVWGPEGMQKWQEAKHDKAAADNVQAMLAKDSIDELVAAIADLLPK